MTLGLWTSWIVAVAGAEPLILETDHAMAVHLPTAGLNQIGQALQNILPPSIPVAAGTNTLDCSSGTQIDYSLADIDLIFAVDDVEFVTSENALDLLVTGHLGSSASTATIVGDCSVLYGLDETCDVQLGTTPFTLSMGMTMELTETGLAVHADDPIFEVAPVTNPLSNCMLAGGVDTILGQDPYVFSNLIQNALEPELVVIPESIESNLDGILESLIVNDSLDLLGKEVSVLLEPSALEINESGLLLGFGATMESETLDSCIDSASWTPPEDTDWPSFTGTMFETGMRYDAGIFVGQHFVNQVLYTVWASEALCIDVAEFAGLDFTGEFAAGFLGSELGILMGSKPVNLSLSAQSPMSVVFSDDQPPMSIDLSGLSLQSSGEVLDREILLQSIGLETEIGLYLDVADSRLILDVPVAAEDFFLIEEYHEVLAPGYSEGVPGLLDLAIGSVLTEDIFPTLVLPEVLGMELEQIIWQPSADGAWLGGHVVLDVDQIQPVEIVGCSSGNLGCEGSGPSIDIDVDDLLGCENTTVGCEGGCSQGPNGRTTIRLPAGRVFGGLLVLSVVFVRRREDEDRA